MLTPSDLRNDNRKSGYRHVRKVGGQPSRGGAKVYYQGEVKPWFGPARDTAREAAQDSCNYLNAQRPQQPVKLKTAGHDYTTTDEARTDEVRAALGVLRDHRAQRQGVQGYVYLIVEDLPGGGLRYGKVGYSTNPAKRVAELQTGNPRPLRLHAARPGTEANERALHAKYIKDNVLQEWFLVSKELLLEWDAEHIIKPAASAAGGPKEVKAA